MDHSLRIECPLTLLSRLSLTVVSAGLYQHLQFTRLRAIESRRAVLLSTVSGISALIHPSGTVEEIAGWMAQDVSRVPVPTYRGQTFYVRHGDWVGRFALGLALLLNVGGIALSFFAPELVPRKPVPLAPVPAPPLR